MTDLAIVKSHLVSHGWTANSGLDKFVVTFFLLSSLVLPGDEAGRGRTHEGHV
jgi:hypothetical protein